MNMLIIGLLLPALIIAYPFMWAIEKVVFFIFNLYDDLHDKWSNKS